IEEAFPAETRALLRRAGSEQVLRTICAHVCATRGANTTPLDEISEQVRDAVREFAENEVAPQAEHIHRTDALIPESFISEMSELGYFGLAVPEEYGGSEMGNLAMILTTEELEGAARRRHRRTEAALAAEDRRRRDHGRHRGHRAGHRQRCRITQVPRRAQGRRR
ncbi:MAG: acyl-CoA dehydrogenase family protein, partial [Deltaproteobacteria bacterium]|nr:acyl-CoA dehydrogenase family protein [Deltaproteobacteria bacterium]